jgi:hypothetical protein
MGRVGSVQSAPPSGKIRQGWVDADRAGYALFQNALVKYRTSYYSEFQPSITIDRFTHKVGVAEADRRARIVHNEHSRGGADDILGDVELDGEAVPDEGRPNDIRTNTPSALAPPVNATNNVLPPAVTANVTVGQPAAHAIPPQINAPDNRDNAQINDFRPLTGAANVDVTANAGQSDTALPNFDLRIWEDWQQFVQTLPPDRAAQHNVATLPSVPSLLDSIPGVSSSSSSSNDVLHTVPSLLDGIPGVGSSSSHTSTSGSPDMSGNAEPLALPDNDVAGLAGTSSTTCLTSPVTNPADVNLTTSA